MKYTKLIKILTLLLIVCSMLLTFSGCSLIKNNETVTGGDESILKIYDTYVVYAKESGQTPLSYEDWLASIKGEKGDKGEDGQTPTISISDDGFWVINGTKTEHKATGKDGKDGTNGTNGTNGADGKDGKDGKTPTISISDDGYWIIDGEKTNHKASTQTESCGVKKLYLNEEDELIIELVDGNIINVGQVNRYGNTTEIDKLLILNYYKELEESNHFSTIIYEIVDEQSKVILDYKIDGNNWHLTYGAKSYEFFVQNNLYCYTVNGNTKHISQANYTKATNAYKNEFGLYGEGISDAIDFAMASIDKNMLFKHNDGKFTFANKHDFDAGIKEMTFYILDNVLYFNIKSIEYEGISKEYLAQIKIYN